MKNNRRMLLAESVPQGNFFSVGSVELVAAAGEDKKTPTFKMHAYNGGALNVGWGPPVVADLSGMKANGNIAILRQHDPGKIVGHSTKVNITADSVDVEGVVSGAGEDAQEVKDSSVNGFPWQASIGAMPIRTEFVAAGKSVKVNGQEFNGPLYVVRASQLVEVSFVPVGADLNTSAAVTANAKEHVMNFEQWLQAHGFDKAKLSAAALSALEAAYKGNPQMTAETIEALKAAFTDTPKTDPAASTQTLTAAGSADLAAQLATVREAQAKEVERIAKIGTLCAGHHAEIQAKAIRENWTIEATELAILRAERPRTPSGILPSQATSATVLCCAAAVAGGLPNVEKQFDAPTLEAAHTHFRSRLGLQEMLMVLAQLGGWSGRQFRGNEDAILRAAFSTVDISGILSNIANKFLLAGWSSVEDTWRQIAAIRSVNDFKTATSYRLTGGTEYEEVGPDGELKHGQLGNESFTNQAKTYGKMLAITRQDLINDNLGALSTVPMKLGRGGALKFNKVFWAMFLNNAAFFTSARNNYFEGAGTVLSIDSLTTAETMFLNQTDSDTEASPLGIAPEILLVPNALSTKATSLTRDTEIRDTTASTKYTTANPHAGKWKPVRSSYLSNSAITGNSTTAWYLLANPAVLAVIEACFLNGQQNPTVESAAADFNTLGINLRGYHDFGVNVQEYRAGVKSKGAA